MAKLIIPQGKGMPPLVRNVDTMTIHDEWSRPVSRLRLTGLVTLSSTEYGERQLDVFPAGRTRFRPYPVEAVWFWFLLGALFKVGIDWLASH